LPCFFPSASLTQPKSTEEAINGCGRTETAFGVTPVSGSPGEGDIHIGEWIQERRDFLGNEAATVIGWAIGIGEPDDILFAGDLGDVRGSSWRASTFRGFHGHVIRFCDWL